MLPLNTILGQLEIFEVYEYLDGPRLFAVRNNIGTMFLVFWCDEEEDATGWLYLPISEARLNQLRRKEISFNAAFRDPETVYFLVYTGIPSRGDTAKLVSVGDVDTEFFPPEGYYIENVNVINAKTDGWSFETILNGARPSAEVWAQFIGRFRELLEDIMNTLANIGQNQKPLRIFPQGTMPGSIKMKYSADDNRFAAAALEVIDQLITSDEEELRLLLKEHKINTSQLKDFLTTISSHQLDVEIIPKLATDGNMVEFPNELVRRCVAYLDNINYVTVESIKVPQANDIDKVLEAVSMIGDGIPLIPESIDGLTTIRQIQYYTRAAYAFGLITRENQITAEGRFINSRTSREVKYEVLADIFEFTDFGWAWMNWAEVQYMTELIPETAADFLIASVADLNEVTAKRRASTLKKWLIKLQPYHRKYKSSESE